MANNVLALLAKLQSLASPNSTLSQAGNMDAYQKHVMESQMQGVAPMTFEEFQKSIKPQGLLAPKG